MASSVPSDPRATLLAKTGKDLSEFVDPSGQGFTHIAASPTGLVLHSQREDGTARPYPHLTIPFDGPVGPHYTELTQVNHGDPTRLQEHQTPVDLATGKPGPTKVKGAPTNWVRRPSLGDLFVQAENTKPDGHSKPGRVGTKEAPDIRRTRSLSITAQSRTASGIGPGFNAFKPHAEASSSEPQEEHKSPGPEHLPPIASPSRPSLSGSTPPVQHSSGGSPRATSGKIGHF